MRWDTGLGCRAAFLAAAAACWSFTGTRLLGLWIVVALIAYRYEFGESDNLWDHLLDPAAVAIAMLRVISGAIAWKRTAVETDRRSGFRR